MLLKMNQELKDEKNGEKLKDNHFIKKEQLKMQL